jgi:F-type H+-transporting ATPase subunit gamma
LKSIRNIAKITKSMKMISATKLTRAQKEMDKGRTYGQASYKIFDQVEAKPLEKPSTPLVVAVSSDRGLCGAVHSSVCKAIRSLVKERPETRLAVIGDKARNQLQRDYRNNIDMSFNQIGRVVPTYMEASLIADQLIAGPYDMITLYFNHFRSVIAYETQHKRVATLRDFEEASKLAIYEIEDDVHRNFYEFMVANTLYWTLVEGHASEMSARMTAMENATKNANEVIGKLNIFYNRTRQAVITNELVDIITGASAL